MEKVLLLRSFSFSNFFLAVTHCLSEPQRPFGGAGATDMGGKI